MKAPKKKQALIAIIIIIVVLFFVGVFSSGLEHIHKKELEEKTGKIENKQSLWEEIYSHHFKDDPRPVEKVKNKDGYKSNTIVKIPTFKIGETEIDMSITGHVLTLMILALIICILFILVAGYYKKGALKRPSRAVTLVEVFFTFTRDDIVRPSFDEKSARKVLPFFITLFMLLLFANLWSNVALIGTAPTANFAVTTTLMLVCFFMSIIYGMVRHGILRYWISIVPNGVPGWLVWFMWIMELIALVVRYVALTIRLFANMVGGHVALFVIIAIPLEIFEYLAYKHFLYILVGPVALAVGMLELFVAVLQAYIFVLLASIFMGMSGAKEH